MTSVISSGDNGQSFLIGGLTTNGINTQMSASGTMTALMTALPTMTYWRFRFVQHTNFSMLSICQQFASTVAFGATANLNLPKAGDLVYFTYAVSQIPGIRACPQSQGGCGPSQQFPYAVDNNNPCAPTDYDYFASLDGGASQWLFDQYGSCGDYETDCAVNQCGAGAGTCDGEPFAHWVNAIGMFMIKRASLMIGSQGVDTLYNDYLYMWEELAAKPGKRLTEMVGKYHCREDLIAFASCSRVLYTPLPFYFTQTPGNALPSVAVSFAPITLSVQFEQLQNCIIVSGPGITVNKCNGNGPIGPTDLSCVVETCQVFLDMLERDRFAATWFEQLITQTYALYTSVTGHSTRVDLNFNYSVIEIMWAVRRKCNESANNWFNYSGIMGKDPLIGAGILFNGQERQPLRNASWYRLVQPYQHHSLIPDAYVYSYSFSLYPEEAQPAGHANFTRLASVSLVLEFQEGLEREDLTIIVFSRSYNLLKFREGVAGVAQSA